MTKKNENNLIIDPVQAYFMACLENAIRWEYASARIYAGCISSADEVYKLSSTDEVYKNMVNRASTMISAFEIAFGVDYF